MIWFCFGKENNSSRRVILKIELELNNLNSILSRSVVTPVFPDGSRCAWENQSRCACLRDVGDPSGTRHTFLRNFLVCMLYVLEIVHYRHVWWSD